MNFSLWYCKRFQPLVKYDCAGAVVVTAANGAYTYKSKELKDKVKDTTTKQYTTLELLAVEGGAYKVAGGYIDGRAAVAKLNPLKDNPHKSGKCVVMQANTHILKTPPATLPSPPVPHPFLKILYFLCYVISYNLTKFVKIFVFFFLDNVMLSIFVSSHN